MKFLINDGHEVNWSVREDYLWEKSKGEWSEYKFFVLPTWTEPEADDFLLPGQYFILAADNEEQTSP